MSRRTSSPPLPEKLAQLLQEVRWIVLGLIGIYLTIILYGYRATDPAWTVKSAAKIMNPGGKTGAWLADVLLSLFGISAWWWVVFMVFMVVAGYRRLALDQTHDRRSMLLAGFGFFLLLWSSCSLEAMRFYSVKLALPSGAGGILGLESARMCHQFLGFTGGTLILLGLAGVGFSLFSGLSWLRLVEGFGALLESSIFGTLKLWQDVQDRRVGRQRAQQREQQVEGERKKVEQDRVEPLHIEPPVLEVPKSAKQEREKLKEQKRERQASLFDEPAAANAMPALSLLDEAARDVAPPSAETLEFTSRLIERKLADFGVEVKVLAAYPGPVVTRFEIEPATGVKGAQVVNLVKDLARALSVISIRVVETIPGKSCMGLELPNPKRQTVRLSEILGSGAYHDMASPLTMALGKDIGGLPKVVDLAKMPHLLVAGTTGSGKSVGINAMILSLLYKSEPNRVRLILVDPKMLELSVYEGIPHLLAPVVTDMKHAYNALNWCVVEMDKRYKLMSTLGVRNLAGYNHKVLEAAKSGQLLTNPFSISPDNPEPLTEMPFIVVVIDELADLMMVVGKKIEELIARLAQKARAAGIHLILATQRPSVDVITGLIKANIPTRIAFQVSSKVDSRTILDQMGAEALLGQGDMLFLAPGTGLPMRVHGAFVSDDEVHRVVEHWKKQGGADYVDGILEGGGDAEGGAELTGDLLSANEGGEADPLYDQAVEVVIKTRRPSISLVQRHLRIGYNRAARLIEQMEKSGVVSAMQPNGNREVLAPAREES